MEKFTGTSPEINNIMEKNMVETISKNSGTNPEINDLEVSKTTLKSRRLSKEERERLSRDQTSLRHKSKKLERLNSEKSDLKKSLKRGYRIIVAKNESENENPRRTRVALSSLDKLRIKDRIIDIDLELFELKEDIKTLSKNIVLKRGRNIQAKKNDLSGKKMAQKQKRNAISTEEDSAPVFLYQPETESEDTQSSDGEFDFMDERELVIVPLQNKETKISVISDAEVI